MAQQCACPEHFPSWHEQDVDLSGNPILALKIPSFLYMPISYESYLQQQLLTLEQLELSEQWPGLVITRTGFLRGEILRLLTSGHSASRHVKALNTPFTVRGYLHNGGIGSIKESTRQLQMQIFDRGHMPKELYLCYLTCPICSEKKGGDKILLLRRWNKSATLAKRIQAKP
ncbi:MAG: hypothetical protein GXP08_14805 [Gammaproteobacteria bacterium]|nr:hypothetical protein [Gammaproteobacteria bacterium]